MRHCAVLTDFLLSRRLVSHDMITTATAMTRRHAGLVGSSELGNNLISCDTVLTGSCSSFLRIALIFKIFLETESRCCYEKNTKLHEILFFFFFLDIVFCVLLQKEGIQGPPQPLRQRAPPAKMPREAEAHPKPGRTPKGGRGVKRWGGGGG